MHVIREHGATFAYPSRTVYHVTQPVMPAPPIDG